MVVRNMVWGLDTRDRRRHRSCMGYHWGRSLSMGYIRMGMGEEYSLAISHHIWDQGNIHRMAPHTHCSRGHKGLGGSRVDRLCMVLFCALEHLVQCLRP